MTDNRIQRIGGHFTKGGAILRGMQLRKIGVDMKDVQSLLENDRIVRLKSGYYAWKDQIEHLSDYQIATATIPDGTICFVSAASLYGMTTLIPDAIHIAVPNKGRFPQKPTMPPIELIAHKPTIFSLGRTEAEFDSGRFFIYDRERTVCDCVKRRDEIGDDIALEVIKSYMRGKRDIQKLYDYARRLGVLKILKPYVEALA